MTADQNADLLAVADLVGGTVAAGVSDSDRDRILADLRTKAITAVRQAQAERPDHARLYAVRLLRDATGCGLAEGVPVVNWAMEQIKNANLDRHRVPTTHGWRYEFPNGHDVSVINDPHRPFRFEVCSKALNVGGDTIGGLTSEQVEAKLHHIAALPADIDADV